MGQLPSVVALWFTERDACNVAPKVKGQTSLWHLNHRLRTESVIGRILVFVRDARI